MKELENLINLILKNHQEINDLWKKDPNYQKINTSKTTVSSVYNNQNLLFCILNYREFLIKNTLDMTFNKLTPNNIEARIKNKNSIQYKIENYTKSSEHEYGNVPLKKCLNDLFGIRIILQENIDQELIIKQLKAKYSNLKIINANKKDYRAIHIYFVQKNNTSYQWELQIWQKIDQEKNYISHKIYKQDYVKWEKERGD